MSSDEVGVSATTTVSTARSAFCLRGGGAALSLGFLCFIICCEFWDFSGLRASPSVLHLIQYSASYLNSFPVRCLTFSVLAIH